MLGSGGAQRQLCSAPAEPPGSCLWGGQLDQWAQVMQFDLTDLLGGPGPRGSTHQSPHRPQAGKAGVSLPPPCLPGVCWGHRDRVRRQVAFSLASPSPPTSFVKARPHRHRGITKVSKPRNSRDPKGQSGHAPSSQTPQGHAHTFKSRLQPQSGPQLPFWPNLGPGEICPAARGGTQKGPPFFPLGWIVRGGPSLHGHWGLACPPLASRDGRINSRILEGGGFKKFLIPPALQPVDVTHKPFWTLGPFQGWLRLLPLGLLPTVLGASPLRLRMGEYQGCKGAYSQAKPR